MWLACLVITFVYKTIETNMICMIINKNLTGCITPAIDPIF